MKENIFGVFGLILISISVYFIYVLAIGVPYFRAECESNQEQYWIWPNGCFPTEEKSKCIQVYGEGWSALDKQWDKDKNKYTVMCFRGTEQKQLIQSY